MWIHGIAFMIDKYPYGWILLQVPWEWHLTWQLKQSAGIFAGG